MSGPPERMTDDDLRAFVLGYCDGRIFTSYDLVARGHEDLLGQVFMPLALGALAGWSREDLNQIGVLWEECSRAGPLAVNGDPMFVSFNIMHSDDWERARKAINAELQRRGSIDV